MGREKLSPEERLRERAAAFKLLAEGLPYGREREDLLLRARRLETASVSANGYRRPGCHRPRKELSRCGRFRGFLPTPEPLHGLRRHNRAGDLRARR